MLLSRALGLCCATSTHCAVSRNHRQTIQTYASLVSWSELFESTSAAPVDSVSAYVFADLPVCLHINHIKHLLPAWDVPASSFFWTVGLLCCHPILPAERKRASTVWPMHLSSQLCFPLLSSGTFTPIHLASLAVRSSGQTLSLLRFYLSEPHLAVYVAFDPLLLALGTLRAGQLSTLTKTSRSSKFAYKQSLRSRRVHLAIFFLAAKVGSKTSDPS